VELNLARRYGKAIARTDGERWLVTRTAGLQMLPVNDGVPTRLGERSVDVEVDGGLISPLRVNYQSSVIRGKLAEERGPGSVRLRRSLKPEVEQNTRLDGVVSNTT